MSNFRPWSYQDMVANTSHLPIPQDSGGAFAQPFEAFCREFAPTFPEIKRLLLQKMRPVDFESVKPLCERQHALVDSNWDGHPNAGYRQALTNLCQAVTAGFPMAFDLSKVIACAQQKDESINTYIHRLIEVFAHYGGME